MNPITEKIRIGTVGELLVQLRLLQFGVQAAPPLKDSGNDLIAIRGEVIRAIQVKATARQDGFQLQIDNLPNLYHLLAIVKLTGDEETLFLDQCLIFILPKEQVRNGFVSYAELEESLLTSAMVNRIFA